MLAPTGDTTQGGAGHAAHGRAATGTVRRRDIVRREAFTIKTDGDRTRTSAKGTCVLNACEQNPACSAETQLHFTARRPSTGNTCLKASFPDVAEGPSVPGSKCHLGFMAFRHPTDNALGRSIPRTERDWERLRPRGAAVLLQAAAREFRRSSRRSGTVCAETSRSPESGDP